jgi:hypothetical protein
MATIGNLVVDLTANTAAFKENMEVARRLTRGAGEDFRTASGHSQNFGRVMNETGKLTREFAIAVHEINPVLGEMVSRSADAALSATRLGVALAGIAAGAAVLAAAVAGYIEKIKEGQQFQAAFNLAVRSGDLGALRNMYGDALKQIEEYTVKQRQATQAMTDFRSAAEVVVSFWQTTFSSGVGEATKRLRELAEAMPTLIFRESAAAAAQLDSALAGTARSAAALSQTIAASQGRGTGTLDALSGRQVAEAMRGARADIDKAGVERDKAITEAQGKLDTVLKSGATQQDKDAAQNLFGISSSIANDTFDRTKRNIQRALDLTIAQITEARRKLNVEAAEKLRPAELFPQPVTNLGDISFEGGLLGPDLNTQMAQRSTEIRNEAEAIARLKMELDDAMIGWEGFEGALLGTTNAFHVFNPELPKASRALADLDKGLIRNRDAAALFGVQFDQAAADLAEVRNAMIRLTEDGLSPLDSRMTSLHAQFDELRRVNEMRDTFRNVFEDSSAALSKFSSAVTFNTKRIDQAFADMARSIGQSLLDNLMKRALEPIQNKLMDIVGQIAQVGLSAYFSGGAGAPTTSGAVDVAGFASLYAKGGVFRRFAGGGVVRRSTVFPMADGWGLMGEAGPEAVMPLARTSNGALGVRAEGAGASVEVTIINNAPSTEVRRGNDRRGPDGKQILEFVVEAVESQMDSGRFDGAMGRNYALRRSSIR